MKDSPIFKSFSALNKHNHIAASQLFVKRQFYENPTHMRIAQIVISQQKSKNLHLCNNGVHAVSEFLKVSWVETVAVHVMDDRHSGH